MVLLGRLVIIRLAVGAALAHDLLVGGVSTLYGATKLAVTIAIANTTVRLAHLVVLLTIENSWVIWHRTGHSRWEGTSRVGIFTSGGTSSRTSSSIGPWCTNISPCCRWRSVETLWLLE